MLPHVLLSVRAVGHRMGRTRGSQQPGQAWVYWHQQGLGSACGHPGANALHPQPCLQTTPFPSSLASGAAAGLAAPSPQVGPACTSPQGTQWRFLWRDDTWKRAQALPDPPYLHTGVHPAPAILQLLKIPIPVGCRSTLWLAQIYLLFYIHTPLIFTVLLEQYPGLLIMPAPPLPMCIHHAPTKVPSETWGPVSAVMGRLVCGTQPCAPPSSQSPRVSSRVGTLCPPMKQNGSRCPCTWLVRVPKGGVSLW